MAESPSETFSEMTQQVTEEAFRAVVAHRDELMEMLKWNAAIVAVMIEEAGGLVEIKPEDLEKIDLNKRNATVQYDEERNVYIVKGEYDAV